MSHRFVRCPHCKMPHDAVVRVCPNTGFPLPAEVRSHDRERRGEAGRSWMSEHPPPERRPEPLAFAPRRDRIERRPSEGTTEPPTAPPRELIGQTLGGRYRIKGVLGEGGMGTVYDAEHLGLGRHVAIKVLSPSQAKKRVSVKRFQQEARAAGAIGHPNICEVYDLGLLDDGSPYLVMEKLVGQTLADRIAREGGLPFDEVIEVMVQVLSGLAAAHEKGILHRDIKPENIFLSRRLGCPPVIKLLDFGVSKMLPEFQTGEDALDLTRTGMVMGTPYYMSPEQARGDRNLDGRVDVYACGVVMYEALAGKRPFLAPNYNALLLAIINTAPRPLREARPETPPELEAIVMKAMAKDRANRFPSAPHFLRELAPPAVVPKARGVELPAPPTEEERRRAPVLGGGRSGPRAGRHAARGREPLEGSAGARGASRHPVAAYRPPVALVNAPSTTLRSPTADSPSEQPERRKGARGLDGTVELEPPLFRDSGPSLRGRDLVGAPLPDGRKDGLDLDIPIHVEDLEEPTAIFRPERDDPAPLGPRSGRERADDRPAPAHDWENETLVTPPEAERPAEAAPSDRELEPSLQPHPFDADETMKLDDAGDVELVSDRRGPRRRR